MTRVRLAIPSVNRRRAWRSLALVALLTLGALAACGERISGPAARFEIGPIRLIAEALGDQTLLPPGNITVRLYEGGSRLLATSVVPVAEGVSEVPVTMEVTVEGVGNYSLEARVSSTAGDTLFASQRVPVKLWNVGEESPPSVDVPISYVGPGANAAQVRILASPRSGFSGDTLVLSAEVVDAQNAVIPNVPLEWLTDNGTLATVVTRSDGRYVLGNVRGSTTVMARTYGNVSATTTLSVQPLPTTMQVVGAGTVSGEVATAFGTVKMRAIAGDGQPVRGIGVNFAAPLGGITIDAPSVVTDSLGEASTTVQILTVSGSYSLVGTPARGTGTATVTMVATPAVADTLTITGNPSGTFTAGDLMPAVSATIKDRFGNLARDSVSLQVLDAGLTPVGVVSKLAPTAGVANFSAVQLTKAGAGFKVRVFVAALADTTTNTFQVDPGAPAAVAAPAAPTGQIVAGETFPPFDVTVTDAFGNEILTYAGNVTVSLVTSTSDTLRGTVSKPLTAGVATFNDLSAVRASTGNSLALSIGTFNGGAGLFDIIPAAPVALVIVSAPPASVTAGAVITPLVVESHDEFGNKSPSTATVTASLITNPTADVLLGTTSRALVAGSVSFNDLSLRKAGSGYAMQLATGGLAPDTIPSLSVIAGPPAVVTYLSQPQSGAVAGAPFAPFDVSGTDAYLNPATGSITLTLENNGAGALLIGTLTRPLVEGVATFDDVAIGLPGSSYTLRATAGAGVSAASDPINITPPVIDTEGDQLFIGGRTACGISDLASGYCWGSNLGGQAGVGSDAFALSEPWLLQSAPSFERLSVSSATNKCALTSGGQAYCWGTVPGQVSGAGTMTRITVGGSHQCGITSTGTALCWGTNSAAQLGDGTTTNRSSPTTVAGGLTFSTITAGALKTCALTAAGRAYCWGFNGSGQLGDGTTTTRFSPTLVTSGIAFASLVSGANHTCALTGGGIAFCWGLNDAGQLGDGTTTDRFLPTPVSGGLRFRRLMAGESHTCGLTNSDEVHCWGSNTVGQLGTGTVSAGSLTPTRAASPETFSVLAGGSGSSTCAIRSDGIARCWGSNMYGQLGDASASLMSAGPTPVSAGTGISMITAGGVPSVQPGHACAVSTAGLPLCWGASSTGALGQPGQELRFAPFPVSTAVTFSKIYAGGQFTCGLSTSNLAYCWGQGSTGALGNGSNSNSDVPVAVSGARAYTKLSVGENHACGLTAAGELWCWGSNNGRLGNNATANSNVPVLVQGGFTWVEVAAGALHTCGIDAGGGGYCWGQGVGGRLGNGGSANSLVPTVTSGGLRYVSIAVGESSCGTTNSGTTVCWGPNTYGQLGNGTQTTSDVPTLVSGSPPAFVQLHSRGQAMCGVSAAGAAYCWGDNRNLQLGTGSTSAILTVPTPVGGGLTWRQIHVGSAGSCGVTTSDVPYCWGLNHQGLLGNNREFRQPTPVSVSGLTFPAGGLDPRP